MNKRAAGLVVVAIVASIAVAAGAVVFSASTAPPPAPAIAVVPQPVAVTGVRGEAFQLRPDARVALDADPSQAGDAAEHLAALLRAVSGFDVPVVYSEAEPGDIALVLGEEEAPDGHAAEGYRLRSDENGVRIGASTAAGLWNGVQTLRQLLPVVESGEPVEVEALEIVDYPRFAYRSAMLDVARHFFTVDEVERFIDEIAMLKINTLHIHLANDQGWRIEIEGWPRLTEIGGQYDIDAGPGGFYSQEEFTGLVEYAAARNIMIVPEANMPGHTHAALTSYGELTCDGVAPEPLTHAEGNSLCPTSTEAERLAADVVQQLAALAPGPYLHLGGDEVTGYTEEEYVYFMNLTSSAAHEAGKTPIGWHEVGASDDLPRGTIGQYWGTTEPTELEIELTQSFLTQGGQIIMSPADVAYLDQVYPDDSRFGLDWAGPTDVDEAYSWDPADVFDGVGDEQVLGIEAPLWTETIASIEDAEFMVFPRLGALAEIAWSPAPADGKSRDFDEFGPRLVAFLAHFEALGVNFHRSSDLPW